MKTITLRTTVDFGRYKLFGKNDRLSDICRSLTIYHSFLLKHVYRSFDDERNGITLIFFGLDVSMVLGMCARVCVCVCCKMLTVCNFQKYAFQF